MYTQIIDDLKKRPIFQYNHDLNKEKNKLREHYEHLLLSRCDLKAHVFEKSRENAKISRCLQ